MRTIFIQDEEPKDMPENSVWIPIKDRDVEELVIVARRMLPDRIVIGGDEMPEQKLRKFNKMHDAIEQMLQSLVQSLERIYGDLLVRIVWYGSTARGDATEESDIDVAIFLNGKETPEMYDEQLDVAVDLELACDRVLSIVRIDINKFNEWIDVMPFYRNIQNEGIVLWPTA